MNKRDRHKRRKHKHKNTNNAERRAVRYITNKSNNRKAPRSGTNCTNQQPLQRGGAIPDPVCFGSKVMLAFLRAPVTPGTPLMQNISSPCCTLSDRRTAASPKSVEFFLSSSTAGLLILLLSPDERHRLSSLLSHLSCSVCAGSMTWKR